MVIVGRPMNSNDQQRCPFDKFLIGLSMKNWQNMYVISAVSSYILHFDGLTVHNLRLLDKPNLNIFELNQEMH